VHIEVTTDRLRLRPFTSEDLEALHSILGDAETMRPHREPYTRDGVAEWIALNLERYERDGCGFLAVEYRGTGEFLGDCGPAILDVEGDRHVGLGWHIRRDRWGEGFATEAGAACRDWCWANLGVDHLICLIRPENHQSCRVAEKLGMTSWRDTIRGGLVQVVYRIDHP
jgi:[ribosomal protein S5]-alanine N-acetyltransferase